MNDTNKLFGRLDINRKVGKAQYSLAEITPFLSRTSKALASLLPVEDDPDMAGFILFGTVSKTLSYLHDSSITIMGLASSVERQTETVYESLGEDGVAFLNHNIEAISMITAINEVERQYYSGTAAFVKRVPWAVSSLVAVLASSTEDTAFTSMLPTPEELVSTIETICEEILAS